MDLSGEFFDQLVRTVRLADVLDVALVAAFLFIVFSWLRQSTSRSAPRRVLVVGLPLVLVYFLADTYDLVLVESLVQLLIFVLLLALVVVFQSDLRRLLDRIGAMGFRRPKPENDASETVNNLAAAAGKLAASRTGALIAIKGSEPWDSHVQGGIPLGGEISRPLLYSIFAPETPGHDGAVLVEGDRITAFGVHLPLSNRSPEVSHAGGTRHAAALGLSEECDALVVVVSEESGRISVAHEGELKPLASPHELRGLISEFWDQHYRGRSSADRPTWVRRALENALLSVALAVGAWFLFVYSTDTVQRSFLVPVAFRNVPEEWVLDTEPVLDVRVVLSGPENAFRALNASDLVVTFDLPNPRRGVNELTIRDSNLEIPSDLSISDVDPQAVRVDARQHVALSLPVVIRTVGESTDSLTLIPDRRTVTVFVPEGTSDRPERVPTQPINLSRITTETTLTVPLALPAGARLARGEEPEITLRIERRTAPARL